VLIAVLLILIGIFVIVSNPILGAIPGILLIVIGIVVGVLTLLGRGIGAIAGIGRGDVSSRDERDRDRRE
jgi:hypothetical protein